MSYKIATTSDTFDDTYKMFQDMLVDMCPLDSCGIFAVEGPYSHIYTVDGNRENGYISFSCQIKVPADVWYAIPAGYAPEISYEELPRNAPCNSGKEPFVKFLKKFNKDAVFRLDRRGFSDRADHADKINGYNLFIQFGFMEPVLSALDECGLIPLKGHYSRKEFVTDDGSEDEKERCGQWFYPTENSVIYSGWKTDWGSLEDDAGIVILFERIDEEWNAVAIFPTGNRLNKTIIRIMKETLDEE